MATLPLLLIFTCPSEASACSMGRVGPTQGEIMPESVGPGNVQPFPPGPFCYFCVRMKEG